MTTGALFGVPIPEKYHETGQKIQLAVDAAVSEAERLGIDKRGKEVTPWLLKRVSELTSGESLVSSEYRQHHPSFAQTFIRS
jgi:pseudouridine-5'-phosphate glycosidase/pseudouridine kinase